MGTAPRQVIGPYALYGEIASGGMATVYFGRIEGADSTGFSRIVAIKRLHPQNAKSPEFAAAFLDEATMAARIRQMNVVSVHDVVAVEDELLLVMDYVAGETLARLLAAARARHEAVPPEIVVTLLSDVLRGLDAAHNAKNAAGSPMNLVHRDVSPQNVLVGQDGIARIMDFGIAKAVGRTQTTTDDGSIKGKASYMSPEQVSGVTDARTDLWAASVLAWEACAGRRLFDEENDVAALQAVLARPIPKLTSLRDDLPPALVLAIETGLERSPLDRWQTARAYADALGAPAASRAETGSWVESLASGVLEARELAVRAIEAAAVVRPEKPRLAAPPAKPRRWKYAALVAMVALALVAFGLGRTRHGEGSALPGSTPTPSVGASPAISTREPPPSPEATASAAAAPMATGSPPPPARMTKKVRGAAAPTHPAPASSRPTLCPVVDAEGIVTFRPCS